MQWDDGHCSDQCSQIFTSTVGVWFHVGPACIAGKDNAYDEMVYNGPSSFVGAVKLIHTQGRQGKQEACHKHFINSIQHVNCLDFASISFEVNISVYLYTRKLCQDMNFIFKCCPVLVNTGSRTFFLFVYEHFEIMQVTFQTVKTIQAPTGDPIQIHHWELS